MHFMNIRRSVPKLCHQIYHFSMPDSCKVFTVHSIHFHSVQIRQKVNTSMSLNRAASFFIPIPYYNRTCKLFNDGPQSSHPSRNLFLGTHSCVQKSVTSIAPSKKRTIVKKRITVNPEQLDDIENLDSESIVVPGSTGPRLHTFSPTLLLPILPKPKRKKDYEVIAYATAEEYNLEALVEGCQQLGLYRRTMDHILGSDSIHDENKRNSGNKNHDYDNNLNLLGQTPCDADAIPDLREVLHVRSVYHVSEEDRQIYFFRDGCVVFWNCTELERKNVLQFLKQFCIGESVKNSITEEQSESFPYSYSEGKARISKDRILLSSSSCSHLERFTFSNALAQSVKLGVLESDLEQYIDSIAEVTDELSRGRLFLSSSEVLQRLGKLYGLRAALKMSGLIDTPDFYWERKKLETLYESVASNLAIAHRMQVMSEKLDNCVDMMSLLKSYHADRQGDRLELIIIVLIFIEIVLAVAFHHS